MLAVIVIASVQALVSGGRWLKGLDTTALTADGAWGVEARIVEWLWENIAVATAPSERAATVFE